jgi:hypothetical protein
MKKLMLTIASLLFVSVLAVNAQVNSDTTGTGSTSSQPGMTDDQSNYTRDMESIQSSEVPASLRSTLQGSEYSGWEEGKVYRNATTNEYLIVIGEDDAKVFRFDANGNKIEDSSSDSNSSGSMNSGDSGSGLPSGSTSPGSTSDSTGTSTPVTPAPESTTPGSPSGTTTPETR